MTNRLDYNNFAESYGENRSVLRWILTPLSNEVVCLPTGSSILEIGCGTGNYVIALAEQHQQHTYTAFDLSEEMVKLATRRSTAVDFRRADAEEPFPYDEKSVRGRCDPLHS